MEKQPKSIPLHIALIPIIFLVAALFVTIVILAEDELTVHIPLILATAVAAIVGMSYGRPWTDIKDGMVHGINLALPAILILMVVGTLIGTWIQGGIVPAMIYYGMKVLSPSIFLPATLLICSVVALGTGSSWSTAGTVGVALIGVGQGLDIPAPMVAGAIISGAYFGDKMSPLSDTTNLAPAVAGTDVFAHIRHMIYTTAPSYIIALILFILLGFLKYRGGSMNPHSIEAFLTNLETHFYINPILLLPPVLVIIMVIKKIPPLPALLAGMLIGGIFAMIFQSNSTAEVINAAHSGFAFDPNQVIVIEMDDVLEQGGLENISDPNEAAAQAEVEKMIEQYEMSELSDQEKAQLVQEQKILLEQYGMTTDSKTIVLKEVMELLERGGLSAMMDTVALIMCALSFGGIMEKTGMLETIAYNLLKLAKTRGSLVTTTIFSCIGMNLIAADQYLAIVIPGRMYKKAYDDMGLHPKNLSRALEASGTLSSPLIPWNTCGAFMGEVLGVSPLLYLPYAFLNLLNPAMSIFYGYTGITMHKVDENEKTESPADQA